MSASPRRIALGALFVAVGVAGPPLPAARIVVFGALMLLAAPLLDRFTSNSVRAIALFASVALVAWMLHASFWTPWKWSAIALFVALCSVKKPLSLSGDLPLGGGALLGTALFFLG